MRKEPLKFNRPGGFPSVIADAEYSEVYVRRVAEDADLVEGETVKYVQLQSLAILGIKLEIKMVKVMYNKHFGNWYFSEEGIDWYSAAEFTWSL